MSALSPSVEFFVAYHNNIVNLTIHSEHAFKNVLAAADSGMLGYVFTRMCMIISVWNFVSDVKPKNDEDQ